MTDFKDNEKELDALFGEGDRPSGLSPFQATIKKAKRKAIVRNVLISAAVTILAVLCLAFGWLAMMRANESAAVRDIQLLNKITQPNVEEAGYQNVGNGLFEGVLYFNTYKVVGDIPVDWSDQVFTYSLFGGVSKFMGDHSPIQVTDKADGQTRAYDRDSKERLMEFYHPEINYEFLRNDLSLLDNISENKVVEMALSLDRNYTPQEVREFLPKTVALQWYWADTYSNLHYLKKAVIEEGDGKKPTVPAHPELADQVYGFDEQGASESKSEELFVNTIKQGVEIEDGKYHGEFRRIYDYLRGDAKTPSPENVKVLGVVVTGSPSQLKALQNMKQVRASSLGVIAERYE
jgi:hypothetical protein